MQEEHIRLLTDFPNPFQLNKVTKTMMIKPTATIAHVYIHFQAAGSTVILHTRASCLKPRADQLSDTTSRSERPSLPPPTTNHYQPCNHSHTNSLARCGFIHSGSLVIRRIFRHLLWLISFLWIMNKPYNWYMCS